MIKAQDALIIKLKREVSNMKRKVLSVLLCAGMIATMLAGCGQKNEEAAAPAADDSTAKELSLIHILKPSVFSRFPSGKSDHRS